MGYRSVLTLVDHIKGKKAAAFTSTGEYVATPENFDEARIQELLKPAIVE
jgi:ribose transport system substrate-binding protein